MGEQGLALMLFVGLLGGGNLFSCRTELGDATRLESDYSSEEA